MAVNYTTLQELFEITCLLQGNPIGSYPTTDAIFIPGRAQGDWEDSLCNRGLLSKACDMSRRPSLPAEPNPRLPIVIPAHDGSYTNTGVRVPTGYPGFAHWNEKLQALGVKEHCILGTLIREGEEKTTHTRAETDGFVRLAKAEGWRSAIVIAYPHQLPRVTGCLLKSFAVEDYHMHVTPSTPSVHRWDIPVYGSLGAQQLPRHQHIHEELDRILSYIDKGFMVPLSEIRDYLLDLQKE